MSRRPEDLRGSEVRGDVVDELVEITSIIEDLNFAFRSLQAFKEQPGPPPGDRHVREFDVLSIALWNASMVAYGRVFGDGPLVHERVSRELTPTEENLRPVHDLMIRTRGEHIAHRGKKTTREVARVAVEAVDPQAATSYVKVRLDYRSRKELLPAPEWVDPMLQVMATVGRAAEARSEALKSELNELVNAVGGEKLLEAIKAGTPIVLQRPD